MKPTLMQECYDKYITEEIKERMTHEENRTSKIDFMSLNEDLW